MSDSGDNREQLTDGPGSKQPARRSTRSTHAKRGGNSSGYPPGSRHQARILALQVLYEIDVTDHNLAEVLARSTEDPEESVTPAVRSHVDRLVRGSLSQRDNIDKYISEAAPAFPVTQLPAVDR